MFYASNENAIEWLRGDERITVTISEPSVANKIRKLAKKFPDQVEIIAQGPSNNGYLYAHLPMSFVRIQQPPKKPEVSEEQRAAGRKLIEKARGAKNYVHTDDVFEQEGASNAEEV